MWSDPPHIVWNGAGIVVWLVVIVALIRVPGSTFKERGRSKPLWILLALGLSGYVDGFGVPLGAVIAAGVAMQVSSYAHVDVTGVRVRRFPFREKFVRLDAVDRFEDLRADGGKTELGLICRDGSVIATGVRVKGQTGIVTTMNNRILALREPARVVPAPNQPTAGSPAVADEPSTTDKRWGALAHLGVPLYSLLLPVVLYRTSSQQPFRRLHARGAIPFQAGFLAVWVVIIGLAAAGVVPWGLPPVVLAFALACEVPNVSRALRGRLPLSFLP